MPEPLLTVRDLGVTWMSPQDPRTMVAEVSFSLAPGDCLCLLGETGCGKTLAAQALLGLLPPEMAAGGQAHYHGRDLFALDTAGWRKLWGRELFLFPQEPQAALTPTLRAGVQLAEVYRGPRSLARGAARALARRGLAALGLNSGAEKLYPCQLSGGMRQRLAAAITAAEPARLVVCDEPSKGLDPDRRREVVALLAGLVDQGKALLVITHDLEVARGLGGTLAVMYAGRVLEMGPAEQVLAAPRHPYTQALWAASPGAGLVPIPWRLHQRRVNGGCGFADRCALAMDFCFLRRPLAAGQGHWCRCHAA